MQYPEDIRHNVDKGGVAPRLRAASAKAGRIRDLTGARVVSYNNVAQKRTAPGFSPLGNGQNALRSEGSVKIPAIFPKTWNGEMRSVL